MKKIDFLKLAILNSNFEKKKWIVSAFAMTQSDNIEKDYTEPYTIKNTHTGYFFVSVDGKDVRIEDADPSKPLFAFLESITIDDTWFKNVDKSVDTYIGNVFFNAIVMVPAFGKKIPFLTGKIKISKIESIIAPLLADDSEDMTDDSKIYVHEYIHFVDNLQFIGGLSQLCTVSATEKNIQIAPGIEAFKKELIKKYGNKLLDPTEYVKFEKELENYDDEYLKGDPSMRGFMSGKVKATSRKKLFLTMGSELTFGTEKEPTPVINSLHEGWPRDPKQFTTLMNTSRSGSFSRGAETIKGGTAAKVLLRSASNFKITDLDCGTELGIPRKYNKDNINNLVGRYIITNKTSNIVENIDTANTYLEKDIIVRSPMYCTLKGDRLCQICAGKRLSENPNGLAIPLTDISAVLLSISMAAMHGKVLSVSEMKIDEVFS